MVNILLVTLKLSGNSHLRHVVFLCCGTIIVSCSGLTMALIDAAYDKQKAVRDAVCSALYDLGLKQPKLVLSSCSSYLTKHAKVGQCVQKVYLIKLKHAIIGLQ